MRRPRAAGFNKENVKLSNPPDWEEIRARRDARVQAAATRMPTMLQKARVDIDAEFGEGTASRCLELVAAHLQAAAIHTLIEAIRPSLSDADAIREAALEAHDEEHERTKAITPIRHDADAPQRAEAEFLRLLEEYEQKALHVSCRRDARTYAPKVFSDRIGGGIKVFEGAMHRLLDKGVIRIETYGPPSKRMRRIVRADAAARIEP